MDFGTWLRTARITHPDKLTQTGLAVLTGVNQRTISFLEAGKGVPKLDTAACFFKFFGEIFLPPDTVITLKTLEPPTTQEPTP